MRTESRAVQHRNPSLTSGTGRAPAWFRYGVIALAAIILCSCTQATPAKGDEPLAIRSQTTPIDGGVRVRQWMVQSELALHPPTSPDQAWSGLAPSYGAACESGDCQYGVCTDGYGCGCPVQGPRDEYLCDGGDHQLPAAVTKHRTVDGLELEDTIAHYDTPYNQTFVTPSNKVCIYAPRFAVVRQVIDLRENKRYEMVMGSIRQANPGSVNDKEWPGVKLASLEPKIDRAKQPPSLLRERRQPGELDRDQRVAVVLSSVAPAIDVQVVWTGEILGRDIVKIARGSLAAITYTGIQAPQVLIDNRQAVAEVNVQSPGTIYHLKYPSDPRLRLIKLASKADALPGEEVVFTLRYDNVGNQTLSRIAIVDSLTTRLEYVDGSQQSSDPAHFSTSANDGESLILRWELKEPLKPGNGGVLTFKTRVK